MPTPEWEWCEPGEEGLSGWWSMTKTLYDDSIRDGYLWPEEVDALPPVQVLKAKLKRLQEAGEELAEFYKDYQRLWDNEVLYELLDAWVAALKEES